MTTTSASELPHRIAGDLTERLTRLDEAAARVRVAADDEAIHDLRVVTRRLERSRRDAARAASAVRVVRVRRAIERALRNTERRVAEEPRPMGRLSATIFAAREQARAALAEAMRTGDDAGLHGARIAVKRLRYAIETLGPAEGEAALARRARDLQHALGDVHDTALLRDRIGRRVRRLREHGADVGAAALGPLIELVEASRREALAAAREQAERLETRGHDRGLSVVARTGAEPV